MKLKTKIIFLNDGGEKFFGDGPFELLKETEKTGSLRGASLSMNMAYTKALSIIKHAEKSLGFELTKKSTGGKSGGGSVLTPQGKEWLLKYEKFRNACIDANSRLYTEFFSKQ